MSSRTNITSKVRCGNLCGQGFWPSCGQNWNFVWFKNTCNHSIWIPDEKLMNVGEKISFLCGLKPKLQVPKDALPCLKRGCEKKFGRPPQKAFFGKILCFLISWCPKLCKNNKKTLQIKFKFCSDFFFTLSFFSNIGGPFDTQKPKISKIRLS